MTNFRKAYIVYGMNLFEKKCLHYLTPTVGLLRDIVEVQNEEPVNYYPELDGIYIKTITHITELVEKIEDKQVLKDLPEFPLSLSSDVDWSEVQKLVNVAFSYVSQTELRLVSDSDTFEMSGASMHPHFSDSAKEILQNVHEDKMAMQASQHKLPSRIHLEPRSYDQATSVLSFAGVIVPIALQDNKKGKHKEGRESYLMRRLFFDVNSMRNGITYRRATTVVTSNFSQKHVKQVRNYIAEINKKVYQSTGVSKERPLIIFNQKVLMINSIYL